MLTHQNTEGSVLVVEDNWLIASDLSQMLNALGWQVMGPAASVKSALLLLHAQTPTVAVLDINLGAELVTPVALQLQLRGIPFVFASAYRDLNVIGVPELSDAISIQKPVSVDELSNALDQAIASRS